ncbi:MAG: hypothetical protein IT329_01070 [Caldilineaceae bacterium]|nr:hypothetical protein [Caldilineaceae bacterium]
MGKIYSQIDGALAEWIQRQHLFFVATAPLSGEGLPGVGLAAQNGRPTA